MTVKFEISLHDFDFWGGAKTYADYLTWGELNTIESCMEEMEDSWTATEVNDFIQFNPEIWTSWLGTTEDEILERGK